MQGFEHTDRKLTDAAALAGHLIPAGSMFACLAAHRAEGFPDADYADLFAPPGLGRPSIPATQMAAVRIAAVCTGHDYGKPGKPKIDWDDPQAKDALVSALVDDANAVVATVKDVDLDERAASALALLALVAGQDVEPAAGSDGTDGRWRIARNAAADRAASTLAPAAPPPP